jgi:hypothetical protein
MTRSELYALVRTDDETREAVSAFGCRPAEICTKHGIPTPPTRPLGETSAWEKGYSAVASAAKPSSRNTCV